MRKNKNNQKIADQHKKDKLLNAISAIENVKKEFRQEKKEHRCAKNSKEIQKSKKAQVYLSGRRKRHRNNRLQLYR